MSSEEVYRSSISSERTQGSLPLSNFLSGPPLNIYNACNISYGLPFHLACAKHMDSTFHASRAYILVFRTLANTTSALRDLQDVLGNKVVGVKTGLKAHTSWNDVLDMKREFKDLKADIIITLGGGSLTDAGKLLSPETRHILNDVQILANDVNEPSEFHSKLDIIKPERIPGKLTASPPVVPVICIPTTLSAGEYTMAAGATEDATNAKYQFLTGQAIKLIILDAALVTKTTPAHLWISSGFRAVDHCVEGYVSTYANPITEEHAIAGLRQLVPSLLRCRADDKGVDVEARHLAQMGAPDSIAAAFRVYTPGGASHAIGHMLGPFGVGHGETSAILLPAVCAYNARHGANEERQRKLVTVLWEIDEFRVVAEKYGLGRDAELSVLLRAFTRELGLPESLKEVGVVGERVDKLAEYSLLDVWMLTNPRPIHTKDEVLELLAPIVG